MASPKVPSAKLLAKRGAQIEWNKAALDAIHAGMVDGLVELGEQIIADAQAAAPRDPEIAAKRGVPMLADTGYVTVWGQGKLVYGSAQVAASRNKPKGLRVPKDQAVMIAAFGSPLAHLVELGTVKMVARPFLTPAVNRVVPGAESVIIPAVGKRVKEAR